MLLLALLAAVPLVSAGTCGSSGIPFRFEVLPSGTPVLGCGAPSCFGAENAGRDLRHDALFKSGPEGDDGFFRQGDLSRPRVRHGDAPSQMANCPRTFDSNTCSNPLTWVGGFEANEDGELRLQCCSYEGLRHAAEVGRPIVHPGEVYSGGEVLRDGRQTGFDAISNIKKIETADGSIAYEVTVTRMNCLPDPPESTNSVSFDVSRDIGRILDKVDESNSARGVQTNEIVGDQRLSPSGGGVQGDQYNGGAAADDSYVAPAQDPGQQPEQFVQVGEQVIPVTSAGYYYPVASGVPACFTGDGIVRTPEGPKHMRDVHVGDLLLTAEGNGTQFTRVASFMHRLPETRAAFVKLQAGDHVISLTPQHFIYKADCDSQITELVYAEDVRVGDCLLINKEQALLPTEVTNKSIFYETGVYAPMTETGDLIVDDVYASCHNVIKANTLSHTFLSLASGFQQKFRNFLGSVDNGHLPATSEFFLHVIDVLLPMKY
ncbi:unnamed protein product [Caenorhabditis auriculariae]|uniref:Uncharacterized protein n=1 Tax=Caenorhabditis auriculariae TaxID=2777116 RepID=A0A8S1HBE4_9PELO|nr:unnamed protein product [Caenorhabditis auriculariae]